MKTMLTWTERLPLRWVNESTRHKRQMIASLLAGFLVADATSAQLPVPPVVAPSAAAFPLRDVRLRDGPLKHSQDVAAIYL